MRFGIFYRPKPQACNTPFYVPLAPLFTQNAVAESWDLNLDACARAQHVINRGKRPFDGTCDHRLRIYHHASRRTIEGDVREHPSSSSKAPREPAE